MIKYSSNDKRTQLVPADDAARANWGGEWRMPTAKECEELVDPNKCKWEWITKDGVLIFSRRLMFKSGAAMSQIILSPM